MRVFLAALCLAGPIWLAAAVPAHACSCAGGSLQEQISAADFIVIASTTDFRLLGPVPTPEPLSQPGVGRVDSNGPPAAIDIAVHEYVKGAGPASLTVYESGSTITVSPELQVEASPRSSAMCGTFDDLTARYLLFLYRAPEGLVSGGVCGGSTAITQYNGAEDYVARVREAVAAGPIALPNNGSGPARDSSSARTIAFAGALGATLAGVVLLSPLALRIRRGR